MRNKRFFGWLRAELALIVGMALGWTTVVDGALAHPDVESWKVLPAAAPDSDGRATAAQVGAVMALLATFQEADVLPPETSPDANRLIQAAIQFQAVFMKSSDRAVTDYLASALAAEQGTSAEAEANSFRRNGWTSRTLEALVDYATAHPLSAQPGVEDGLRAYHVGPAQFDLLARTFLAARSRLRERGLDIHRVYEARRKEMPGAARQP